MSEPLTSERREEIRAALEPLPPYPWRWGSAWKLEAGGTRPRPVLTTGITSDAPEFLFLAFEESGDDEGWYLRSAEEIAELGRTNPVADWIENGAQYAEELLLAVDRLTRELKTAHAVRIPTDTLRPLIDPNRHTRERAAAYLEANGFKPTEAVDIWERKDTCDLMLLPGPDIDWADSVPYFVRNMADALGTGELGVLAGIAASGMDGAR